jgi:hypothetical protein
MTMQATSAATPMTVDTPSGALRRYTKKPNRMARTMKSMEIMAVRPLAMLAAASSTPSV